MSISYKKYSQLVQNVASRQSLNFIILSSIYICIISIFLRGSGVLHSNTVHLIVSFSKTDCPIYQEENSLLPQTYSRNYFLVIKIHLKFIMSIKTCAIQSFKGLSEDISYKLFLSEPLF